MGNETTKPTKPPKYILQDGYLYERVPKKKLKEAISTYSDMQEMLIVASGGKMSRNNDLLKEAEKTMGEN